MSIAYQFDFSWAVKVNPDNTPWVPGFRFEVSQKAKKTSESWRMKVRTYRVCFQIDPDGHLRHTGGPIPTDETLRGIEELYSKERPGSNRPPAGEL